MKPSVSAANTYTVSLTDSPVLRETSDATANELATAYMNGIITVNPSLSLRISQSGTNVTLSWPDWASAFTLQESTGALPTTTWSNLWRTPTPSNSEYLITVPVRATPRFYRLYKP